MVLPRDYGRDLDVEDEIVTAPGTFNREKLVQAMGLKTLNQMDDLPVYGNEPAKLKAVAMAGN